MTTFLFHIIISSMIYKYLTHLNLCYTFSWIIGFLVTFLRFHIVFKPIQRASSISYTSRWHFNLKFIYLLCLPTLALTKKQMIKDLCDWNETHLANLHYILAKPCLLRYCTIDVKRINMTRFCVVCLES